MINFAAITPHPPIIIPGIGSNSEKIKVKKTVKAMERIAKILNYKNPETIIIISPHSVVAYNEMTINSSPELSGNLEIFGNNELKFNFKTDLEMTSAIYEECKKNKIPIDLNDSPEIDHGCLVPLYFLSKEYEEKNFPKIVVLSPSFLDRDSHFNFGKTIFNICKNKKTAIIASGDLSHKLSFEAPEGFSPEGIEFDKELINSLKRGSTEKILDMDKSLIKKAGECGYLPLLILLGILSNKKFKFNTFSYESPFGVGYLVGNFKI